MGPAGKSKGTEALEDYSQYDLLMDKYGAKEIPFFISMSRAADKWNNPQLKRGLQVYADSIRKKIDALSAAMLDRGSRLMVRHLLDDIEEEEYIEAMEELKDELKALRKFQDYVEFVLKKIQDGGVEIATATPVR